MRHEEGREWGRGTGMTKRVKPKGLRKFI